MDGTKEIEGGVTQEDREGERGETLGNGKREETVSEWEID